VPEGVNKPAVLTAANAAILTACIAAVLAAAVVQNTVVTPTRLDPDLFLIPLLVGASFGAVIVSMRTLLRVNRLYASELRARQARILSLNEELEARVAERTEELATKQQQLLRSQRQEVMGQLTGGIVHDMNNILLVIQGTAELARYEDDPAEVASLTAEIEDAAERGHRLLRNLLDTTARQGETQIVTAAAAAEDVVGMLSRSLGARYRISVDAKDTEVRVPLGATEQILLNLLVNARDAMPDGGEITVTVDRGQWEGRATAVLAVSDGGPGIPEDIRDKIFQPFFSTKTPGEGTGLGLATIASLCRDLGGHVELVTSSDGTTFTVSLPAA
jgi:signal transduction histidine kinase